MWAAAEGQSKLGIPKSVGEEFVRGDAAPKPEFGDLSDFEAMEAMRDGELPSPTKYGDFWLFDLRITGTGAAFRDKLNEYAFRDPKKWLSEEFLKRCGGLPVIFDHPERSGLNHQEFRDRSIGNIFLPYIKGEEVWGIAKIFDADAAELMQTTHRSTSPGVTPPKGSIPVVLEDGSKVLDEGLPLILDHLAVCQTGVWDKSGPPEGIRLDSLAAKEQAEVDKEEREKLEKERDDAVRRADAAEAELTKSRKDAEETEREAMAAAEREREDGRKKRHDSGKHDGTHKDCERCDSEEKKEKDLREAEEAGKKEREAEERAREDRGRRKDGAPTEDVDANQIKELKDSQRNDSARIQELEAAVKAQQSELELMRRQPSIEDRNAISSAFHLADSVYQMVGDQTPLSYPGENPIAYRRRLADGLRKHSAKWKDHSIHDSIQGPAFDIIEKSIYDDATNAAKTTLSDSTTGRLREITTVRNGKTYAEFYGDARKAWEAFMPPMRNVITRFNNAPGTR